MKHVGRLAAFAIVALLFAMLPVLAVAGAHSHAQSHTTAVAVPHQVAHVPALEQLGAAHATATAAVDVDYSHVAAFAHENVLVEQHDQRSSSIDPLPLELYLDRVDVVSLPPRGTFIDPPLKFPSTALVKL